MKRFFSKITPVRLGISIGALVSVLSGLAYVVVWHERGSAFYPFAGLAFVGGPLAGGIVAAWSAQGRRRKAFVTSGGAVFGLVCLLFFVTHVIVPQFARTTVDLTVFGEGLDGRPEPTPHLKYTLQDGSTGILVTSDGQTDVVAVIGDQPPYPSTVFLVNESDGRILRSLRFENDVIAATIDEGTLYLYNDKLGYFLDARTGEFEENFLLIDNYVGLSESDRPILSRASTGRWYMETTAVISAWRVDGTVRSRRHLAFNCIALGCFIAGETHEVTKLRRAKDGNAQGKTPPQ